MGCQCPVTLVSGGHLQRVIWKSYSIDKISRIFRVFITRLLQNGKIVVSRWASAHHLVPLSTTLSPSNLHPPIYLTSKNKVNIYLIKGKKNK